MSIILSNTVFLSLQELFAGIDFIRPDVTASEGSGGMAALIAAGIFLLVFIAISFRLLHETTAALLGAIAVFLITYIGGFLNPDLHILTFEDAMMFVDWNVIFLIMGMMIFMAILSETNVFRWIGIRLYQGAKGNTWLLVVLLVTLTGFTSAFLNNVTAILLLVPLSIQLAVAIGLNPLAIVIAEVLASNIGGAATLIGDPPNVLICSAANIDFLTFLANLGPVIIVIMIVFIGVLWIWFRSQWSKYQKAMAELESLDTSTLLTDKKVLRKSAVVMGLVMIVFLVHGVFHLEPATIALGGAIIMLLWTQKDVHTVLRDVEWATLFVFIGLFIAIEGFVQIGIIETIGKYIINITGGDMLYASMLLLCMSSLFSGIVDNIPYTATMIPVVQSIEGASQLQPL